MSEEPSGSTAPLRVVLAGGGTAGHVEPALSVADALRRRDPATQVTVIGTARGIETRLVPARGYPLELVPAVPVPRRPSADLVSLPSRVRAATKAAERVLEATGADVLAGFGGYAAAPAYLAARRRHVPYVVHEANARPGLANRLGARWTPYVAVAVAGTRLAHAVYTGMPLRTAVTTLDRAARRTEAAQSFGLDPALPTLLAFGGSQGARQINRAVEGAVDALLAAGAQVLHVVGPGNVGPDRDERDDRHDGDPVADRYVRIGYCDRMELAYAAADLALCRAGMTTCAELAAVGLPAVYVPLPIGNGEQRLNAEPVVAAGGGLLVDDAACTPQWLRATVLPLLLDGDRLAAMGRAAATLGVRDADERLADMVLRAAGRLAS
jgi:UDP-N-acetylglucosamine--N-acetylmuramyl-(pentapeptide) pyrophosphoryl-undecaprenol N-acetylglucosamine transferase